MNESFSSMPSDAGRLGIPYKFTLVDLNTRSYFLIHEVPEMAARTESEQVNKLRDHLRQAIVLGNLEVCLTRNWQMAGQPAGCAVDLTRPAPSEPPDAAADARRAAENDRALAPVQSLLSKSLHLCTRREVSRLLDERVQAAEQLLEVCGEDLARVEESALHELAFTFAAYQPAVLDEEIKGSQSPLDPRSHTRSIGDVQALVARSAREAGTHAPEALARLAVRMLAAVRLRRSNSPLAAWLLQGACMSGHSELVSKLLDRRSSSSGLYELDIIRRLRAAWLGYQRYRPLQALRTGAKAHTIDWLDFKCSCARAVLIAHAVVETLILRDDQGLTQSVQVAAASAAAAAAEEAAAEGAGGGGGSAAALPPPSQWDGAVMTSDPSFSLPPAAVANGSGVLQQSGSPEAEGGAAAGGAMQRRVVVIASPPATAASPPGSVAPAAAPHGAGRGALLDESSHVELEPAKWALVRELFPRAAACKPLALAILHVVLAGKREVQRAAHAVAEDAAAAAARGGAADPASSVVDGLPPPEAAGSECDDDLAAGEAAERARMAEEARTARYRKLHLLAVQAAHLAVHSSSLSTVSDAIAAIRAVRAWPAIDLAMLNDLAEAFPHQCAALLAAIPLQEVDLEDNVLPFGLPPGFTSVAVSDKDAQEFRQGGGTGSTQDAQHFATQREADASIEASLLVLGRTWMALLFLFWPAEFASPTTRQLLRVLRCACAAFLWQGPGSCAAAAVFGVLLLVTGVVTRVVLAVVRILYCGILYRIWGFVAARFPSLRRLLYRIRGRPASLALTQSPTGLSRRVATTRPADTAAAAAAAGDGQHGAAADDGDGDEEHEGFTRQLGLGLWRTFFAHGHNRLIDWAVGWGKGSASISCRKLPMPVVYASQSSPGRSPGWGPGAGGGPSQQMDTALLEKLLKAPGLHPSVFGSKVLRALILFKWNYFTKYFIILQLLLHITYMAVFLTYAFTIKDMEPVDGRESGPGANTPGCQLQAPTRTQLALLIVLAVMTVDFLVQELRQIRHFGLLFLTHTWDLLDVCSVALVVASVSLHLSCTSDVSPLTLRGLAAVQIVLLFMRLLYYAMASDKLGSFVRMVLETTYDLIMFFAFLSVVFVGFALAIIISQGTLADEEQTFIKLFTMMYGDFDVTFLSTLDSGALGLDALTRVLASVYMILVTIILLNLLISVISESYERIRENEKWESLRNKALLVVESETQLYQFFLTWLYTTLTPPSLDPRHFADSGKRYLYVITPEYARNPVNTEAGSDDEEEDEEYGDDDEEDDGQWNGRLGEMKRHITAQARATADVLHKEVGKLTTAVESVRTACSSAAAPSGDVAMAGSAVAAAGQASASASPPAAGDDAHGGGGTGGGGAGAVSLDARTAELIAAQVGTLLQQQLAELRREVLAEVARAGAAALPQQQHQGQTGRLSPISGASTAMASLPPLAAPGATVRPEGMRSSSSPARSTAAPVAAAAAEGADGAGGLPQASPGSGPPQAA